MSDPIDTYEHRPTESRRPHALTTLFAALLAISLIAACTQASTPTPDPQPTTLSGFAEVYVEEDEEAFPLLGATMLFVDFDVAPLSAALRSGDGAATFQALQSSVADVDVSPSSVIEVQEGVYLAGIALVESDGGYELVLPEADAIPAPLMRPAQDAIPLDFYLFDEIECSIVSSDPTVLLTQSLWLEISFPAPFFFLPVGLSFGLTATDFVDIDDGIAGSTFITVVYANGATTLSEVGSECSTEDGTIVVDIDLVEGWQQLTWSFSEDGISIGSRPIDETVFSTVFPAF